jgi:phage shock protein PspC (stress-responsive transcriptional regulator)
MDATTEPHRTLRRPSSPRMVAGVAAGIARYLGVEVTVVRVAFVVLTVLGGAGPLVYLAAWLLIPADGAPHSIAEDVIAGHRSIGSVPEHRRRLVAIAAVVIGILILARLAGGGGPGHRHGPGVLGAVWVVLVVAIAAVVVRRRRGGPFPGVGPLVAVATTVAAALVVLAAVVATVVVLASGIGLGGGVGDRQWAPVQASSLAGGYHLAVGNAELDLSRVALPAGTTRVAASVGVGRLTIDVPAADAVSLSASSTTGEVIVFGRPESGLGLSQSLPGPATGPGRPTLDLSAKVGIGQVVIRRVAA